MVYQGIVMEVEKSHIIVLTDDTNYVKLQKKGNIDIGKKIMFIEDDIIKKSNRSYKTLIGVAAAIILMIVTIIGQFGIDFIGNFQAYAIVSLDINPSLEFQIDEKEIVKKINYLNKDGREIIDDNMVGMKIEDAIILSIKKAINKQYLNKENNVVLVSDVILDNNAKLTTVIENEIFEKVEEDKDLQDIDLIYVDSDKEDLEKAKEHHVSVGKYKVYKIISHNKPDVKVEDIKDKKVSEIVKENEDLTKGESVKTNKKEKQKQDESNVIKDKNSNENDKIYDKSYENKNTEKTKENNKNKHGEGKSVGIKYKEINANKHKEKEHKEVKSENKINEGKENDYTEQNNIKESHDKGFEKKNQEDNSKENIKYDNNKNEKAKKQDENNKDNKDNKNDNENGKDKDDKNKKTNNKNKGK